MRNARATKRPPPFTIGVGAIAVLLVTFIAILTIRIWGIGSRFWLLEDQIRDWSIALRPFRDLPLVGRPTPITPDEWRGRQLGAATVVPDGGAECLHSIPFEPLMTA